MTSQPIVPALSPPPRRSGGAALLMALFVAALATLIVGGLFWRQFVLLRTVENQQLISQSRLLLSGALDWARSILREDAARTTYDALSESWAQPLAETRLDQIGEVSALASQATMAGGIEDAQARLNLRNLVRADGSTDPAQQAVLSRLASLLSLPQATADLVGAYVGRSTVPLGAPQPAGSDRPLALLFPEDLARIPGVDPAAAQRLAPYVAVLDERTPVNFNTASPEMMAACIEGLSLADARGLAADRDHTYFQNTGDIRNRLRGRGASFSDNDVSVSSRYFFIRGEVRLSRADTRLEALVKRGPPGQLAPVDLLWEREL
jgi:general secretion pathway protein K